MSADSLFGGGTDLSQVVSDASLALINAFLTDTVGGSAIVGHIGGSTLVIGSGSEGEKQGALVPSDQGYEGSMNDGVLYLDISMPEGTGFVFEGMDNANPQGVGNYLFSIIDAYLPPGTPGTTEIRDSLYNAVNDLVSSLTALGASNIVVRMIDFVSDSNRSSAYGVTPGDVVFDASGYAGTELLLFNLNGLNQDQTLVLSGIENVMLAGNGTVRIEGDTGVRVTSDLGNQDITGGGGNDTLIGGGGNDTLTGGAGDDIFGFVRLGNFTIGDFGAGDKIAFNVPFITDVNDLVSYLTQVTQTADALTLGFGPNFSLTLVGVSASEVTADMFTFTF